MILPLLQNRRSVRRFQQLPVEPEKVLALTEALLRAPSSRGRNPWEFIVVDDPATIKALAEAKAHGSAFLDGAPLVVVVCGDPERSDVWIEDCAIASILLHLTASSLDLGSCWVQIRSRLHRDGRTSEDYLRALLGIPDGLRVLSMVAIGYPGESKAGHDRESLEWRKVRHNHYSDGKK